MAKIRGVIFDLDGTLIDTLESYVLAFNRGIKEFGVGPVSKERLATFLNRALSLPIRRLAPPLSRQQRQGIVGVCGGGCGAMALPGLGLTLQARRLAAVGLAN